jgi:hypothetical protein
MRKYGIVMANMWKYIVPMEMCVAQSTYALISSCPPPLYYLAIPEDCFVFKTKAKKKISDKSSVI